MRQASELRERARLVAFVSGRGLADLERLVDIDGCAYAGNHGMEMHRVGHEPELAEGVAEHLAAIAAFAAPGRPSGSPRAVCGWSRRAPP